MNLQKTSVFITTAALLFIANGCSGGKSTTSQSTPSLPLASNMEAPTQLPARYQNPGYVTAKSSGMEEDLAAGHEAFQIRVGATIKSTAGPQPLWDVLKRLANLKGMTVSWATDVDQNYLVDVDINAQDLFQDAVTNLLRQADYFHEMQGRAIVVKNKTTKTFHIGVPYTKGDYTSNVGGNFLPRVKGSTLSTEGTVKLNSSKNQFDIWNNIQTNLDVILDVAARERAAIEASNEAAAIAAAEQAGEEPPPPTASIANKARNANTGKESTQRSTDGAYYIVDKSTGTVTVTAKPSVMAVVENYFNNLKQRLYRQISIEAKIVEVVLNDHSKIGLDWSSILENLNVNGQLLFGADKWGGSTYMRDANTGEVIPSAGSLVYGSGHKEYLRLQRMNNGGNMPIELGVGNSALRLIRGITLTDINFNVLLNALEEQGESHVLSNPKLTVLNGQPAVLSVGKVTRFVSEIERDVDRDDNSVDYSVSTDSVTEGVSMGVIATLIDDTNMILQLTPVTTELEGGTIAYRVLGRDQDMEVGLPVVNMREMATTVQVADGELLVIGGLIDNMKDHVEKFPPIVGKIPIVKYLFGYEEKTEKKRELVILLTPKIL